MIICDTGPIFAAADRRDADHHACVELFTGLRLAGRRLLLPQTVMAEVGYMLKEARSRVVFTPHVFRNFDHAAMMRRLLPSLAPGTLLVAVRAALDGMAAFDELLAGPPAVGRRAVDPNAVKLLMYTSGTTGRPKGVLHSHNTLNADSVKQTAAMGLGPDDCTFSM